MQMTDSTPAGHQKLNVAVIGAGGIAESVHLPSLAEMDDIRIVAICDIVEAKAAAMAERYHIPRVCTLYKPMLETEAFDAVFVLVEPSNLFDVAWHCLAAGRHVFMEKPPGLNSFQAESLLRRSDASQRFCQVGFNRRHIPLVRHVHELMTEQTRITAVEGSFYKFGSAAFDHGGISAFPSDTIHAVDLVRWFAGGTPARVATVTAAVDEPFLNAWHAIMRFDNGVLGTVKGNYQTGGRVHKFEVHGPGLSAYIDLGFGPAACEAVLLAHEGARSYSLSARGAARQQITRIDGKALAGGEGFHRFYGFYHEDRHFLDCIRRGTEPDTSIRDAVSSMHLTEMILANAI